MIDIIILNVPRILSQIPLVAPAMLKASVLEAGFSVKTIDFNIKFYNEFKNHPDYSKYENYFLEGEIDVSLKPILLAQIEKWVDIVLSHQPKWVAISVFIHQCRIATKHFCEILRKKNPNVKIVIGGQGVSQGGINGENVFPKELKENNLIDHYIKSEGEISLVNLLKGNLQMPGIDSDTFNQLTELNVLPQPNYDDYIFSEYNSPIISITGSRGCVRKCNFCDIHRHWKYVSRKGIEVFEEIKFLSNKYKIYDFIFTDSLVNGNHKEFCNFLEAAKNYNTQTDKPFSWSGQYIVKSKKIDDSSHFKLMKMSQCKEIFVGVESGSEKVRKEMNKSFSQEDLYNTIERCAEYGIGIRLLMFVGYPTETLDDFTETLNLIKKYKHLAKTCITQVEFADTLSILPGTPLYDTADENKIIIDTKFETNWYNINNPGLDLKERIRRTKIARQLAYDLGFIVDGKELHRHLHALEDKIATFGKRINIITKYKEKNS